jgi:hypothetical protein
MASTTSGAVRNSAFRMTLHTEVAIGASPKRVWDVLTDFKSYQHWNAAIPSAEGQATRGTILRVLIHWPGLRPRKYKLAVVAAQPERELRWLGHFMIAGLLDGDHSFIVESTGTNSSTVTQREDFSGLLVPLFAPWLKKNILNGFHQMNTALKRRAEH